MTTYLLLDNGETPVVTLEADSLTDTATNISKAEGAPAEVEWMYDLLDDLDQDLTPNQYARFLGRDTTVIKADDYSLGEQEDESVRGRLRRARRREPKTEDKDVELADGNIAKIDSESRNVFGWAYVTHDAAGKVNIDKSGDFIDAVEQIEKSAYDFVLKSRAGDDMHTNVQTSTMIESMVFTPEKIEKMGIAPGTVPLGWWIGFHVESDAVWDRVKKGELTAFSIHGSGTRSKVAPGEVV